MSLLCRVKKDLKKNESTQIDKVHRSGEEQATTD